MAELHQVKLGNGTYDAVTKPYVDEKLADKQDTLVSGTSIKTVNGQSLLGSGDLDVDDIFYITVDGDAFTPTSDPDVYEMELTSPYTLAELNAILQSENPKSMILRLMSTSGTTKTINEVLLDTMAPTVFEGDLFYTETYMDVSHSYAKFIIANVGGKTMLTRHTGRVGGGALPGGGTTGQALVKNSDADQDVKWADVGGSDNTFVFDVDSDQFTEDPDNPDGKHYGMTITSPTYDELLAMLRTDTFVYARLLYNNGNAYETMQLFHNGNSIYGRSFDVEFPQKRLQFASAYVNKRNNDTYFGTYQDYIGDSIDAYTKAETDALLDEKASLNIATIPGGGGGDEISATVSQGTDSVNVNYYKDSELPNSLNLNVGADSFSVPTTGYVGAAVEAAVGDLSSLTTTDKTSAVAAINELDAAVKGLGEPFRVKQWGSNTLNVEIPYCTEDIANGSIPKMVFSIDDVEGADYQIVGMVAYEVFDAASGGNRINCWPVCQFTGNGQKELSVRWMGGGTTRKTAKRINAWVLLKHR